LFAAPSRLIDPRAAKTLEALAAGRAKTTADMLSPLEIALFAAVGLIFAAGLIVVARWGGRNPARLAGYALLAACFIYVGLSLGSENPNSWSAVEMTAVAVFGSLIFLSRLTSPWVLVGALLLHPAWLIYVHYLGTAALFTPAPLVLANVGFDIGIALYLAFLALRGGPAPAREPVGKGRKGNSR